MRAGRLKLLCGLVFLLISSAFPGFAEEAEKKAPTVCELIDESARLHGIPAEFFTGSSGRRAASAPPP
jgi:hypothetical protein